MKKVLFRMMLGLAATALADGYKTRDDFGGVTGDAGFWTTSAHPVRKVHVRTVAIPFSVASGETESVHALDVFDSRLCTCAFGTFCGEFSTKPNGLLILVR